MPFRHLVPCIRVHPSNGSSHTLSASGTHDIRDILSQVKMLPNLLAPDAAFDDVLYLEDGQLKDVPPFPPERQPPLFILCPHRNRLLFRLRSEAPELGNFSFSCDEEDSGPLPTAPTLPRMKLIMKEQLYVQKWIDTLTSDNPPNHIPWVYEEPASKRGWIAEGRIFPTAKAKIASGHSLVTDIHGSSGDPASRFRDLFASSDTSAASIVTMSSHTSTPHVPVKSMDVGSGILRGDSKSSQASHRTVRAPQASFPLELLPPEPPAGSAKVKPSAPMAAHRGKLLSSLKLEGSVIEHLEYPDIPTAFLGSPDDLSPRFDTSSVPDFTDHESMILDLRSKCAALGNSNSTCTQEPLYPQPETIQTSLSDDEWAFAQGLATFADDFPGVAVCRYPGSSTPANRPGSTARFEFVPGLQPAERSYLPPMVPLPLRPSLVSPLGGPHVKGILKKVKFVRFEDTVDRELESRGSHYHYAVPLARASPNRSSPPPPTILSRRPCTPIPTTAKRSRGPVAAKEAPVLEREKKPAPRSRLPPRRTKVGGKLGPIHPAPESSKPTLATASVERPCRTAHLKENTYPLSVIRAQAKQRELSIAEVDVWRGFEGSTKNRLSVPLRNIFRFR